MPLTQFSDPQWLKDNAFQALAEISYLLTQNENAGREALIRTLEFRSVLDGYQTIITALVQRAGLYPYTSNPENLSTSDLLNFEFHKVVGLDEIVLHSVQGQVYRALLDGANVILSAPTSFGKSLLIDAMVASRRFARIVVIVPTIALIDETRRRLSERFSPEFKIITHPTQETAVRNIYVLTQERFLEFPNMEKPDFFVLDEFYKLSPSRGDERTFVLNEAFYKLFKSGSQFFLIGPKVKDISVDQTQLSFRYFGTDFATVATEVTWINSGDEMQNALAICASLTEPTLIFCKSAPSAYELAHALIQEGTITKTQAASEFADWLRENFHPGWNLAKFLDAGIAVHHGALPRAVAYQVLRKFNEGDVRFLLCTSTIIEGVNTAAKNIIIYDNRIANQKSFDLFTFNNIKGRAGRMFRHFVGRVFVLNYHPQQELPLVDIPSITQPSTTPESLLIQLEHNDLSDQSIERLRYLYAQDTLPIEIIRSNSGVDPGQQLSLALKIAEDLAKYHPLLSWAGYPNNQQLFATCSLMFDYLLAGKSRDGVGSAKHLYGKMQGYLKVKTLAGLVKAELAYNKKATPTDALESSLIFLRRWVEFHFPRYLMALDRIQRSVFAKAGLKGGDYSTFAAMTKHLFMPVSCTLLEEYGLPFQVTLKLEAKNSLGESVDGVLKRLKQINLAQFQLSPVEYEMAKDVIANI